MLERLCYAQAMKKIKLPKHADVNQLAYAIVQAATNEEPEPEEQPTKNPAAVALGRLGGLKGGKARKESLTPERRKEIAKKAASARWKQE
jgi:hypothetical protein